MIEWFSLLNSGVSIGSLGLTTHSFLKSFSFAKRVDEMQNAIVSIDDRSIFIENEIKKISDKLYELNIVEFKSLERNKFCINDQRLKTFSSVSPKLLISGAGANLPETSRDKFFENPENYLFACQKLISETAPEEMYLNDPTLVPWHYIENGVDMIGFAKRGYLESLGIHVDHQVDKKNYQNLIDFPLNVQAGGELGNITPIFMDYLGFEDNFPNARISDYQKEISPETFNHNQNPISEKYLNTNINLERAPIIKRNEVDKHWSKLSKDQDDNLEFLKGLKFLEGGIPQPSKKVEMQPPFTNGIDLLKKTIEEYLQRTIDNYYTRNLDSILNATENFILKEWLISECTNEVTRNWPTKLPDLDLIDQRINSKFWPD